MKRRLGALTWHLRRLQTLRLQVHVLPKRALQVTGAQELPDPGRGLACFICIISLPDSHGHGPCIRGVPKWPSLSSSICSLCCKTCITETLPSDCLRKPLSRPWPGRLARPPWLPSSACRGSLAQPSHLTPAGLQLTVRTLPLSNSHCIDRCIFPGLGASPPLLGSGIAVHWLQLFHP